MVNVLHQTDLFHPHCDPDDHWDLACQYALFHRKEIDLKAVLIDHPPAPDYGDPAVQAVAQLNYISGKAVPAVVGTASTFDPGTGAVPSPLGPEFAGAELVLKVLEEAEGPVFIHIVGSCRDVAVAGSIRPDLFREKCGAIYLNAGTSRDRLLVDYNVELDPLSYCAVFNLPCTIFWMPCIEYYPEPPKLPYQFTPGEFSTFYEFRQDEILPQLSDKLQKYFAYALGRVSDQRWLSYLELPKNEAMLAYHGAKYRNMWCTGGFLHCAGYTVSREGRLVRRDTCGNEAVFCFEPIEVVCEKTGKTHWNITEKPTNRYIFRITDMEHYPAAMTAAMKELLSTLP